MPSMMEETKLLFYPPRQIRLDTTTTCNASCLSCHKRLTKRQGKMPVSMIKEILTQVSRWKHPLDEIVPVNYGEFFTLENWYEILHLIAEKIPKTKIVLPTNGSMFDEALVLKLQNIPHISHINFSINAYFDETYKKFTGLPVETIERIKKALQLLRILRPDIILRVSMVFDPEYQTDWERDLFYQYWLSFADPWVIPAASAGRNGHNNGTLLPCRSIFSDFVIGYDGKLSSCCFDADFSIDLGYYSGDVLKDWTNEKITALRVKHNEHRRNEEPLCGKCSYA